MSFSHILGSKYYNFPMEVARGKLAVNLSCDLFQPPLGYSIEVNPLGIQLARNT